MNDTDFKYLQDRLLEAQGQIQAMHVVITALLALSPDRDNLDTIIGKVGEMAKDDLLQHPVGDRMIDAFDRYIGSFLAAPRPRQK